MPNRKTLVGSIVPGTRSKHVGAVMEKAGDAKIGKPRWRAIKREEVTATTEMAKQIRDAEPWKYDRPTNTRRLDFLLDRLVAGEFRTCEWALAYCKEDGRTYRVNGKHTSTILAEMDSSVNSPKVVYTKYECETLKDVGDLYNTFDSNENIRTMLDAAQSVSASDPRLAGVFKTNLTLAIASIVYAKRGETAYQGLPRSQRADLLLEEIGFTIWLDHLLDHANNGNRYLAVMGVGAAMYLTFKKYPKLSEEFWMEVRDGLNPNPEAPSRKLQRWLLTGTTAGRAERYAHKRDRGKDRRELLVRCIHAWNAWRKGTSTNLNYYEDADIPSIA